MKTQFIVYFIYLVYMYITGAYTRMHNRSKQEILSLNASSFSLFLNK